MSQNSIWCWVIQSMLCVTQTFIKPLTQIIITKNCPVFRLSLTDSQLQVSQNCCGLSEMTLFYLLLKTGL